jgi:hypothetical protein
VSRDFLLLVFFHGSVSPHSQIIQLGPFQIFSIILGDIRKSGCTTGINDNLPPVSTTPAAKLPPISTTPAANFATSFASVVVTSGKFGGGNDTGGINDNSGKFATGGKYGNNIRLQTP